MTEKHELKYVLNPFSKLVQELGSVELAQQEMSRRRGFAKTSGLVNVPKARRSEITKKGWATRRKNAEKKAK